MGIKGGYEVDFENVTYTNVPRPATFKKGFGGDIDVRHLNVGRKSGSGAGGRRRALREPLREQPGLCGRLRRLRRDLGTPGTPVHVGIRRVSFSAKWTSAKTNTLGSRKFPHIRIVDVTDWKPSTNYGASGTSYRAARPERRPGC